MPCELRTNLVTQVCLCLVEGELSTSPVGQQEEAIRFRLDQSTFAGEAVLAGWP